MRLSRFALIALTAVLLLPPLNSGLAASEHFKTYSFTWRQGFRYHATPWGPVRITAVACPTAHLCAAADSDGNVLTTSHPREGMAAWSEHDVDAGGVWSLACASVKLCLAPYGYTGLRVTSNLFGRAPTWHHFSISIPNQSVGNVTCAGISLCLALDSPEAGGGFWVSTTPSRGPSGWRFVKPAEAFYAIACPSPHVCVAVSSDGHIVYSRTPAGPASSWKSFQIGAKTQLFSAISCPSTTFCAAVDYSGSVYTSSNPVKGPAAWRQMDINGTAQLDDIACASSSLCVASDDTGNLFTSRNPGGGVADWHTIKLETGESFGLHCISGGLCLAFGSAGDMANSKTPASGRRADWSLNRVDGGAYITDVSCGSSSMCIAVGENGLVLSSTNPTGGPPAWKGVQLTASPGKVDDLSGASCPSAHFCVVIGGVGDIYTSINPTGLAKAWSLTHANLIYGGYRMSCAGTLCAAEGGRDVVSSMTPATGPWTDQSVNLESGQLYLNDISCRSASFCALAGSSFGANPGEVGTSTNPTGDTTQWTATRLGQPFGGIFCARSSTMCVTVGNQNIAASTDPSGGAGAWSVFKLKVGSLSDVACGYICMAVGGSDVLATRSQQTVKAASDWSHAVLPAFFDQVSCANSVCVATDDSGQIFAGTAH